MGRDNNMLLFFGGLIVILLLGALWWTNTRTTNLPTNDSVVTKGDLKLGALVEIPLVTKQTIRTSDPAHHTTVNIEYPSLALIERPELAQDASAVIRTYVDDTIATFTRNAEESVLTEDQSGASSDLTMRYSVLLLSPSMISVRFDRSEYIAGAAHPNSASHILNYDIEHRVLISGTEFFASSTQALGFLSEYSRKALAEKFDGISAEEWSSQVVPGTEPTVANFTELGLTTAGIVVIFQPYQVAPYARGTPEIRIPYTAINALLSSSTINAVRLADENITQATPEGAE